MIFLKSWPSINSLRSPLHFPRLPLSQRLRYSFLFKAKPTTYLSSLLPSASFRTLFHLSTPFPGFTIYAEISMLNSRFWKKCFPLPFWLASSLLLFYTRLIFKFSFLVRAKDTLRVAEMHTNVHITWITSFWNIFIMRTNLVPMEKAIRNNLFYIWKA